MRRSSSGVRYAWSERDLPSESLALTTVVATRRSTFKVSARGYEGLLDLYAHQRRAGADFYPILVANSASIQHVRETLLRSIWPSLSSKAESTAAIDAATNQARSDAGADAVNKRNREIPEIKAPNDVDLEYWSREYEWASKRSRRSI